MPRKTISIREERSMRCQETGSPFFAIDYMPEKSNELMSRKSHHLISILKNDNPIILEIDSALLTNPVMERVGRAIAAMKALESFGLETKSRKIRVSKDLSIFEKLFCGNSNEQEVFQAWINIPHDIWELEDLKNILPINGARYYIVKDTKSSQFLMDGLLNGTLTVEEKVSAFELNIFDCGILGQMGIYVYGLDRNEIMKRLEKCKRIDLQ